MGDMGGTGNSSAKGGKSAMKSQARNGESAGKSRKGRKVQFGSEGVFEGNTSYSQSNGNRETPPAKGGKGDKGSSGTKKAATKAPAPPERKLEREIPPNCVCLLDCEAAEILQGIQDRMVFLSQDPDIKLPVSFDTGLMYAKRGGNYAKPQTIKKIFEPLKKHGVSDCEIVLIANISPESVDEVFALIPSLKTKISNLKGPLRIALNELANLKESLANLDDLS